MKSWWKWEWLGSSPVPFGICLRAGILRKISIKSKAVWSLVPPVVCWFIWLELNQNNVGNQVGPVYNVNKKSKG